MSEEDECIFKPPSLPTQIISTHIQGYDRVTMYPLQERRIFSHISYIKKRTYQPKKMKKREHIKSHNFII
jgi:hypothetical protein